MNTQIIDAIQAATSYEVPAQTAKFLAALLSATYYEVDATAFNFTSDTTATFTNDSGKTFNATFDGVNVFFYCHGASHVENIALNARGLSVCIGNGLIDCYFDNRAGMGFEHEWTRKEFAIEWAVRVTTDDGFDALLKEFKGFLFVSNQ